MTDGVLPGETPAVQSLAQEDAVREELWKEAAKRLKAQQPELFADFEKCISLSVSEGQGNTVSSSRSALSWRLSFERAQSKIRERDQKHGDNSQSRKSESFKRYFEQVVRAIGAFSSTISTAISSDIHASLAWTAVCLILPLLLNPLDQSEKAMQGLDYIASLLLNYRWKERVYGTREGAEDFKQAVTLLYAEVLEYVARLMCHLSHQMPKRYVRSVFKVDDWESRIEAVRDLERRCDGVAAAINVSHIIDIQEENISIQRAILNSHRQLQETQALEKQHENLRSLYSSYDHDKNRVAERVPGTCEWFLNHPNFWMWREKQMSAFLWVSGDPGCGKSVLSRYLIDSGMQILRSSSMAITVCYFFFKDGDASRRSGANALCAILHQLFSKNPALYLHAKRDFESKGQTFLSDFDSLWQILARAATDPGAGEIVCVLDALDECDAAERAQLIDRFVLYYSNDQVGRNRNARLKIIATSRPYSDIEDQFYKLTEASSSIRLVGEHEFDQIGREIDLVIGDRIPEITPLLNSEGQQFLVTHLKTMTHRTYLWLHLTLELIGEEYKKAIKQKTGGTIRNLKRLIERLPKTVQAVYEDMLNRSDNRALARRLLRLIVGAYRPLTLQEVNVALSMDGSLDAVSDGLVDTTFDAANVCTCEDELSDRLDRDDILKGKIKNLCGLLVNISSDSKLYLVHQTAREFLLANERETGQSSFWKNSLELETSHDLLASLCVSYLMFSDFAKAVIFQQGPNPGESNEQSKYEEWAKYIQGHVFLDYSANNWAHHLQDACDRKREEFHDSLIQLCDITSTRFEIWCQAARDPLGQTQKGKASVGASSDGFSARSRARPRSSLYVAASLGLDLVVNMLLSQNCAEDSRDAKSEYSAALFKAAEGGYTSIVKVLRENGARFESREGPSLFIASMNGHVDTVKFLLSQEEVDANLCSKVLFQRTSLILGEPENSTALILAASRGHVDIVRILLQHGAVVDTICSYQTALMTASIKGHKEVVQVLLQHYAYPDLTCGLMPQSAITSAAQVGHVAILELLLDYNADPNQGSMSSPLIAAVKDNDVRLVRVLLRRGALVNQRTVAGTALTLAVESRNLSMTQLLLENGADPNTGGTDGAPWRMVKLPLHIAAYHADFEIMRLLLAHGAELNTTSKRSLPALHWAVLSKQVECVQFFLDRGADVEIVGSLGSVIQLAAEVGELKILQLLVGVKANLDACHPCDSDIHNELRQYNELNGLGGTALELAVQLGSLVIVRLLCENGANVNLSGGRYEKKDNESSTPLQVAIRNGSFEIVNTLVKYGAEIDARCVEWACVEGDLAILKSFYEKTPDVFQKSLGGALRISAGYGHEELLTWILEMTDAPRSSEDMSSALRFAARSGQMSCMEKLLAPSINLDDAAELPSLLDHDRRISRGDRMTVIARSRGCNTALQLAAAMGHDDIVSLLAARGATLDVSTERGTALQLAVYFDHPSTVRLLIELGADVNAEGGLNGTALQRAAGCGDWSPGVFDNSISKDKHRHFYEIVNTLLDCGADVHAGSGESGTALQRAAQSGVLESVRALVRYGASIDASAGMYGTALQRASEDGHLSIVRFLIVKGADVNAAGGLFGTALQRAAEWGHIHIAEELLKAGARVDDGVCGTPLQKSVAALNIQMSELLLKYGASVHAEGGGFRPYVPSWTYGDDDEARRTPRRDPVQCFVPLGSLLNGFFAVHRSRDLDADKLRLLKCLLESGATFKGHTATRDWQKALEAAITLNEIDVFCLVVERSPPLEEQDILPVAIRLSTEGCVDMLRMLLSKFDDTVSSPWPSDWGQLLVGAASKGHIGILTLLLGYGFDVNPLSGHESALLAAVETGALRTVDFLLQNGANVYGKSGSEALLCAVSRGNMEIAKSLLNAGVADAIGESGQTPLLVAVNYGREELVKALLQAREICVTTSEKDEAFMIAASRQYHRIAWYLLPEMSKGALNIDDYSRRESERNELERDLVRAAIQNQTQDIIALLDRGVDINAVPTNSGTALHEASARGHQATVQLLIENGANIQLGGGIYDKDYLIGSGTAIQRAAAGGHVGSCKILLAHGANLDPGPGTSDSALERAAEHGHLDVVRQLLEHGVDVEAWTVHPHGAALHRAAAGGWSSMVELLLQYGADVNRKVGVRGTPLQIAVTNGHIEVVRLLLENHADVDAVIEGLASQTPLWMAIYESGDQMVEVVKLLIAKGANVNWTYPPNQNLSLGFDPLDQSLFKSYDSQVFNWWSRHSMLRVAVDRGSVVVVQLLLEAGADVTTGERPESRTPFQEAVLQGWTEVVRLLASLDGVDINEPCHWIGHFRKNRNHSLATTPLTYAISAGFDDIADYLRAQGAVEGVCDNEFFFGQKELNDLAFAIIRNRRTVYGLRWNRQA